MDLDKGKLTKSISNDQIIFGKSRIDAKHFAKFVTKCKKTEKDLLVALKIEDMRTAKLKVMA